MLWCLSVYCYFILFKLEFSLSFSSMDVYKEHSSYNNAHFKWLAPFYGFIELFVKDVRKGVVNSIGDGPKKILDVACGPGVQTRAMAKAGHSVIGIDLSPDMLSYTQKDDRLDIEYLEQDATSTQFSDSAFDVSTISFGLHDMPERIAIDVLKEMKRVTKENGQIIIVEYNSSGSFLSWCFLRFSWFVETKYYWHFVQTGLDSYLKAAGLEMVIKKTYLFGNLQLVQVINAK